MNFQAKVQSNGERLFVYLPLSQCNNEGIVKGSRVDLTGKNSGYLPEPPSERAKAWGNNINKIRKEKETKLESEVEI